MRGVRDMSKKAATNEREYPYIVEFVIAGDKLDVELSRRMMELSEKAKSFFDGVFPIRPRPGRS